MALKHQDTAASMFVVSVKKPCTPQGRCQDFDEYFSINRPPLSAMAFVLQANPSERKRSWVDISLRSLLESQ